MTEVLYRKYRPRSFSEIKGQEHVIQTLKGAISQNKVAHAYLFSGPRGTGKTTMARLFAKTINCEKPNSHEPCNVCPTCISIDEGRSIDIIEIDGASNRGIDEIRNIKEMARVASSQNKYKVFIIDEVHSLTKDAFNALLKTLEEPPAHVKFIMATTEPHKLLPTVLSRVQRFDFRKISLDQIVEKLKFVAEKEKIVVDDDVLKIIGISAEGSLRDAESTLAKLLAMGGAKVTLEDTKEALGYIPANSYIDFLDLLLKDHKDEAIVYINNLYESGIELDIFTNGFIDLVRKIIILKALREESGSLASEFSDEHLNKMREFSNTIETQKLTAIIKAMIIARNEMKISPIPQLPLELAIMDLIA